MTTTTTIYSSQPMPEIKSQEDVCIVIGGEGIFWRFVSAVGGTWDYKGAFLTEREALDFLPR